MLNVSKRLIIRNSTSLYFRSIIIALIGLYASRVLLKKLGVEDYGVYHVVGGVVLMFSSLRTMCTNAIQRFINCSKGEENLEKQILVFNTGVQAQLILTIAFVLLTESVGLYALWHLNLSDAQFSDARIVYQLTIITMVLSIMTVPYEALILAHEEMGIYARISILDWSLQLAVIYLISSGPFTKLVNYAILLFAVSFFIRVVTIYYCRRHYVESTLKRIHNQKLMKELYTFAGWNFLGYSGFNLAHQGVNYLLNLTGGVVVNTARSITYQVMGGVNTLVSNTNMAFYPQTNAAAADSEKTHFYRLLGYNAKASFVCYLVIVVPFFIFAKPLIRLWLGQEPPFVVTFLMAISGYHLLLSLHVLVNQFFISIGQMKWYQVIEFFSILMILPCAWMLLRAGYPLWTVFIVMAIMELVNHSGAVLLAMRKYDFPIRYYMKEVYMPFMLMSIIAFMVVTVAYKIGVADCDGLVFIISWGVAIEFLMVVASYLIVLHKSERKQLQRIMLEWIEKRKA